MVQSCILNIILGSLVNINSMFKIYGSNNINVEVRRKKQEKNTARVAFLDVFGHFEGVKGVRSKNETNII